MLKRILIIVFTPLLALSLFLGVITLSITNYLGSADNIKKTLIESHVYDSLVDNVLAQVQEETNKKQEQGSEDIPFDNPEIQAAIKKALPPEFWQNSGEEIIDGVYGWLDGENPKLEFKIDLKQAKTNFVNAAADYIVTRTEALPVCTSPEQVSNPDDLFNLTCKPPDFNAATAKQEFIAEAQSSEFLGDNDTFDSSDFKSEDGKTIEQQLDAVRQGYSLSKKLPVLLGVIAIILTIALFFLYGDHVRALNKIKTIYLSSGASILVFSGIAWFVFKKVSSPSIKFGGDSTNPELQRNVLLAANTIFDAIITVLFIGGVVYVVIGLVCWGIARKLSGPTSDEQKQNNVNTVLKTKELTDENAAKLDSETTSSATPDEPTDKDNSN